MSPRNSIHLYERQIPLLEWIKASCPLGVYEEGDFTHRISARALENRGLVEIRDHGKTWTVTLTPRGALWPEVSEQAERDRQRRQDVRSRRATGAAFLGELELARPGCSET